MNGGSRHGSHPQARARQAKAGQATASSRGAGQSGPDRGSPAAPSPVPDTDRLIRLLEPVVHALNMDLEGIKVTSAGRRRLLRVVVDADGGVSLDDIALASRELSARLDKQAEMGEIPYTLEVSSPGVDRPLTQPRHWRRAAGRLVVAPLKAPDAAGHAAGRIVDWSESGVTLESDGVRTQYSYAELGSGRVQVEFGHFDAGDDDDDLGEED